ncbi:TPA: bifunctional phosphoribosyl-AMP cyclohydrolase/phosphoribosyl-ATP diphosphatase HisIE [Candidatus Peregrinibacteria bacterium]|nr:bifunctional phosphoribosyl-AMP cyclohydrolase/phosphoribosyl-ATP diphosphatase HisIE [Candidatus Peregrinibacteria bacterium]
MSLNFSKYSDNLIPTIIQSKTSGKVLMLGFSSAQAYEKSKETRNATFFSRSKNRLWIKGEESGNTLHIESIKYDCDEDTLLYICTPKGATCHTGSTSCFFNNEDKTDAELLWGVYETVLSRKKELPENSYVTSLYKEGLDRIIQKVGEEAIETVIAAKNDDKEEFIGEFADLLFHMMVLLSEKEITLSEIVAKFKSRIK